jgi:hypothetical protein
LRHGVAKREKNPEEDPVFRDWIAKHSAKQSEPKHMAEKVEEYHHSES